MSQVESRFPDFLIVEYEQASEALHRNEEGGEKRATFFATVTGATFAVLGFILEPESKPSVAVVHVAPGLALAILLLFGRLTAVRLAYRNRDTSRMRDGLDRIRAYFAEGKAHRLQWLVFNPKTRRSRREDAEGWARKGGWLETTFVINAILAGALAAIVLDGALLLGHTGPSLRILLGAIVALDVSLLAWAEQCRMRARIEGEADHLKRRPAARDRGDRETEAALIISSEDSRRVLADLADAREVGRYILLSLPPERIRDRYFDTVSGDLARRHLALRVRETDSEALLTLKGPDRGVGSLATKRLELEAPWSAGALQRALDELARHASIRLVPPAIEPDDDPGQVLAQAGFTGIQERLTMRERRNVAPRTTRRWRGSEAILAELALDEVEYGTGAGLVRLREVEIEARGEAGAGEVDQIAAALLDRSKGALRPWPYSKLATGKVIERLLGSPELAATLSADGSLTPPSIALLEAALKAGRPPEGT